MDSQNDQKGGEKQSSPANPPISAPVVPQAAIGPNENENIANAQQGNSNELPNDTLLVKYTGSLRNCWAYHRASHRRSFIPAMALVRKGR
jgi:hypothetical protein